MAKKAIPSLASVAVAAPAEPATTAKLARESLHVRIAPEVVERVREAAHRLRRDKQDIAEEALREWLAAHGF
jgi:hypothetical protein